MCPKFVNNILQAGLKLAWFCRVCHGWSSHYQSCPHNSSTACKHAIKSTVWWAHKILYGLYAPSHEGFERSNIAATETIKVLAYCSLARHTNRQRHETYFKAEMCPNMLHAFNKNVILNPSPSHLGILRGYSLSMPRSILALIKIFHIADWQALDARCSYSYLTPLAGNWAAVT